jgi:tRNA(Arg) A34 adenosine deaminase TadA
MTAEDDRDAEYMRQAIAASRRALEHGNRPYGAVLVAADGRLLAEGQNTEQSDRDITGHAETNALREAYRQLGPEKLVGSTMYASGEPCPMCAATIFYSGVSRVVYGISRGRAREFTPQSIGNPTLSISCRDILATSSRPIEVVGPFLEDEAAQVFMESAAQ